MHDGPKLGDRSRRPSRPKVKRGPYVVRRRRAPETATPSQVLAANICSYRRLQGMTQEALAARMTILGHSWSRSTVSAIEGDSRNVTLNELFALAIAFGVTLGSLVDPSGPDHSRRLRLDVGLGAAAPEAMSGRVASLFATSRAVIRLLDETTGAVEIEVSSDQPAS